MILETRQTRSKGKGLFTTSPVQQGILLLAFVGKLELPVNHSCRPNAEIYWRRIPVLCALRPIDKGEEVTCNYATAEYDAQFGSFECHCGEQGCYGTFRGFKHLPDEEKTRLLPLVNPFIASRMKQEAPERVYPIGETSEQVLPGMIAPRAG